MMKRQARLSERIMGLDTNMILEPCLLHIPASEPGTRPSTSHHATMPRPCPVTDVFRSRDGLISTGYFQEPPFVYANQSLWR